MQIYDVSVYTCIRNVLERKKVTSKTQGHIGGLTSSFGENHQVIQIL